MKLLADTSALLALVFRDDANHAVAVAFARHNVQARFLLTDPILVEVVTRLRARAVARLRTDCTGWDAYDCYRLATLYWPGDPETARRFASASCRAGDPHGCNHLAMGPRLGPAR